MPSAEMHQRHARMLARYAELALSLAEQLHADAVAAETADQRAVLAGAFHRICRSGRQSMALEARLVREAAREARAEAGLVQAAREPRVELRKKRLARAVEPLIWTEVEDEDQLEALQDLKVCLAEEALSEAFLDEPLETQLALGLPDPPPQAEVSPQATEGGSSADVLSPARSRAGGDPSRGSALGPASGASAAWVTAGAGTSGEQAGGDLDFDAAPPPNSS